MVKSNYFSNSAKLMIAVSAILLATNTLQTLGSFTGNLKLTELGSSLSGTALYVVLIIGFIAFNGEGVCYKRYRIRKRKKLTDYFKWHIVICFLMNYIKGGFDMVAMSLEGAERTAACMVMSLVSTVITYGFLLCVVSLWYIIRDKAHKKLLAFEAAAFVFGLVYNIYKLFNYAVVKYGITSFGIGFSDVFSSDKALRILCILQLISDIAMFVAVVVHYDALAIEEQEKAKKNTKAFVEARNVYKEEGFGIDTIDDDFLLPEVNEE